MNDEINEEIEALIKHLNTIEAEYNKLKVAISTKNNSQINVILQSFEREFTDYQQRIDNQRLYSQTPQARDIAKSQINYFQSLDRILVNSDAQEREEMSLLNSEFTLDFINPIIHHTLYYRINSNQQLKETLNAQIRRI